MGVPFVEQHEKALAVVAGIDNPVRQLFDFSRRGSLAKVGEPQRSPRLRNRALHSTLRRCGWLGLQRHLRNHQRKHRRANQQALAHTGLPFGVGLVFGRIGVHRPSLLHDLRRTFGGSRICTARQCGGGTRRFAGCLAHASGCLKILHQGASDR